MCVCVCEFFLNLFCMIKASSFKSRRIIENTADKNQNLSTSKARPLGPIAVPWGLLGPEGKKVLKSTRVFSSVAQSESSQKPWLSTIKCGHHMDGWPFRACFAHRLWGVSLKSKFCADYMWPYTPKRVTLILFMKFWFLHTCKEHSLSFQMIPKVCKSTGRFKSYW